MPTILLADDDDGVRALLVERLAAAGFEVVAAADTASALRQFTLHRHIDLCVVDLVMPSNVPDGAAFARSIRNRRPDIPIILITGYYSAAASVSDVASTVIYKPLDLDRLVGEIERLLKCSPVPEPCAPAA